MELVAGLFADIAIERVKNSINKYIDDQFEYQTTDVRGKLQHLNNSLTQIQAVVAVAKSMQIQEPNLLQWLSQLNDAVYDVEYVMDIFEYKVLKEEVESWFSEPKPSILTWVRDLIRLPCDVLRFPCCLPFEADPTTTAKRLFFADEELNDLLDVVKKFDGLVAGMPNLTSLLQLHQLNSTSKIRAADSDEVPDWRVTTSVPDEANLLGRGEAEKRLLELLTDENEVTFSTLSVVGVGGVGKTALVQSVFNHSIFKNEYFDVKAWVCVSSNFSIKSLIIRIVEAAKIYKPPDFYSLTNLESIQDVLIEGLQSKRFLIVLDDVWEDMEEKWDKICKPFHYGKKGSKIIVTSRLHNIAKIMGAQEKMKINLSPLEFDDYWILFQKCAFGSENPDNHQQLKKIGEPIARNLGGLPLAAKVVGALLKKKLKVSHWRDVLESKTWKEGNGVMSALKLSYDYLPTHLKKIFAYCSLFPKDYEYQADRFVDIWVALDFVRPEDRSKRLADIQTKYTDELVSRCIWEQDISVPNYFHMHDLLHDLAESIVEKEVYRMEGDASSLRNEIPLTVRHLYIEANDFSGLDIVLQKVAPKQLRSLVYVVNCTAQRGELSVELKMSKCATQKLRGLRFLFLKTGTFDVEVRVSENLCDLLHLRCIHFHIRDYFSQAIVFPTYFWKLYQLQTLRWNGYNKVKKFSHVNRLINLRYVDETYNLDEMCSSHLSRLKFLEVIPGRCYTIDGKEGNDIGQLEDLNNIGGELELDVHVKLSEAEARKSNIKKKQFLDSLGIVDQCKEQEGGIDDSAIEALQPHENLTRLSINWCRGINKLPTWLPMISSLKYLSLMELPTVKQIDVFGEDRELFPSLVEIKIYYMENLVGWSLPLHHLNKDCFRNLCRIEISNCPKLMETGDSSNEIISPFPFPTQANYFIRLLIGSKSHLVRYGETSDEKKRMFQLQIIDWWSIVVDGSTIHRFFSRVKELVIDLQAEGRMDMLFALLGKLSSLEHFIINQVEKLELLIDNHAHQWTILLKTLVIIHCDQWKLLPVNLQKLSSLETLVIEWCRGLHSLDENAGTQHLPTSIKKLVIKYCSSLKLLSANFPLLSSLESLRIEGCYELESLAGNNETNQLPDSIKTLIIRGCPKLKLPQSSIRMFWSIETVGIFNCKELRKSLNVLQQQTK